MHRNLLPFLLAAGTAVAQSPTISLWNLDESSGTVANDSGPGGNHGALINFGPAPWVPGQFGNALQFDGTDDYVQIAANARLPVYDDSGQPFSITFWVKAPAQSDRRVYSEQAAAPSGNGPLFTLGSGSSSANATAQLRMFLRDDDVNTVASLISNGVVFDDTWHHVAYVDVLGRVSIYIDGTLDSTFDYSRWAQGPLSSLRGSYAQINSVTLGAVVRNGAVAAPLQGLVDDVRVYRAALGPAEVLAVTLNAALQSGAASLGAYGYGCGPGPLDMVVTGSAALGQIIWLELVRGEPGSLALLANGIGPIAPLDLAPFGLPGCTLYQQSVATTVIGTLGASGSSAPFPLPVPNNATFVGLLLSVQGVALGSAVQLSPAAIAHIGP